MAHRLLVIDDSPTIRKLVELSFNGTDWSVEFASTGREGVAKASARPPDLILLDFVLPDMRGTEVCGELARDARTARTPILVMSAKTEGIRELFGAFSAVADCVSKPFSAADVVARANALMARLEDGSAPAPHISLPPGASRFSLQQKEAAARAMYAKLRPRFAIIPELMSQLEGSAPAPFFARKLLTPAFMVDLLEVLAPTVLAAFGMADPAEQASTFQGQLGPVSLISLLKLVTGMHGSGELRVQYSGQDVRVHVRSGEVVLATSHDPSAYARGSTGVGEVRGDVLARAEAEQRTSGKPFFVTLAEAGELSPAALSALLYRQGKQVLLDALNAPSASFSWREDGPVPLYVDAFGRPLSVPQLVLEALRHEAETSGRDVPAASPSTVFERVGGFSRRVRAFELSDAERRVLALMDGITPVGEIASRVGMTPREVGELAHRLEEVELVRRRAAPLAQATGPVLVVDPDVETFQVPLAQLFRESPNAVSVIGVRAEESLYATILRERPRMVIINATVAGAEAMETAEAVRVAADLGDLSLVAVLEVPAAEVEERLATAGFDAVLTKPILFADLERLLVA